MSTDIGDLVVSTTGQRMVRAPERCRNGHPLAGHALVGTTVCRCQDRHLSWTCNECGDTTYGPALGPRCSVLHGPARIR